MTEGSASVLGTLLQTPEGRYMVSEAVAELAVVKDLRARRARLELAACKARREGDTERQARYFGAADEITDILWADHCEDDD